MTLVGPLGISIIIVYVSQIGNENNSLILNKFITIEEFFNNGYILGVIVFIATILQGTLSQNSTHLVNVEGIHLKTALQVSTFLFKYIFCIFVCSNIFFEINISLILVFKM